MENFPTWMLVVAAAIERSDGRWLMHKRPMEKHHGGLWEFPGGKVNSGETPRVALARELAEELDIQVNPNTFRSAGFADAAINPAEHPIVILLYTVKSWSGEPRAMEGGETGWFTPGQIQKLAKPPLDIALADQLFHNSGG